MSNKILLFLSLILTASFFQSSAAAQTVGEGSVPVTGAKLTAIDSLPAGARRIKDGMAPAEVSEVLAKLVAQGGAIVRQGKSEVLLWGGNYQTAKGAQMIERLAGELKKSGWEYELAAKEQGVTIFTLLRDDGSRRALVGFFAPSNEAFLFAVTEMLPADAEASSEVPETSTDNPEKSSNGAGAANSGSLVGRWTRSGGSGGSRDFGGKTLYNSGNDVIFEFSADGTMQFINDKNTLSITQCRISELTKIPGSYTVSGDSVTMNLGAGTSIGKSSCETKGNFKKTLSASTVTKTFVVKRLESVFRPDAPYILCFDGSGDAECFEKTK